MSESGKLEASPSDLERRHHKTRERIVDALALATAMIAVIHYNLDGIVATVIVFVGAYIMATLLWQYVWATSAGLFGMLSALIYLATFVLGLDHLPGILVTMFLPAISQAYLIWAMWPATGSLFHPLTLCCLAWVALLGIRIFEGSLFADWRPLHSNRKRSERACR